MNRVVRPHVAFRQTSQRFKSHIPRLGAPRLDNRMLENPDKWMRIAELRNMPALAQSIREGSGLLRHRGECTTILNRLRARRNELSSKMSQSQAPALQSEARELKTHIRQAEMELHEVSTKIDDILVRIPNDISPNTPDGPEENAIVTRIDSRPLSTTGTDHVQIADMFDLVDFASAASVSGSSFYYLKNAAMEMELALVAFALRTATARGWHAVSTSSIVKTEYAAACGFQPRDEGDEQQIYHLSNDICLAGTAEIPLAGMKAGTIFTEPQLPLRCVGVGRAFRRESGARGKQSRGLYRVHEFTKVELFAWTRPDDSDAMLKEIVALQRDIIDALDIPARMLRMPTQELGASAYEKYDIEGWMPGRQMWGELTSASNCTDYQARRLGTQIRSASHGLEFAHTLNGTAAAIPRLIVAILENNYMPGPRPHIRIPSVLQPFMGRQVIEMVK